MPRIHVQQTQQIEYVGCQEQLRAMNKPDHEEHTFFVQTFLLHLILLQFTTFRFAQHTLAHDFFRCFCIIFLLTSAGIFRHSIRSTFR